MKKFTFVLACVSLLALGSTAHAEDRELKPQKGDSSGKKQQLEEQRRLKEQREQRLDRVLSPDSESTKKARKPASKSKFDTFNARTPEKSPQPSQADER